jgi:hypothetical protein
MRLSGARYPNRGTSEYDGALCRTRASGFLGDVTVAAMNGAPFTYTTVGRSGHPAKKARVCERRTQRFVCARFVQGKVVRPPLG